jgi:uncharacterized protein (TIGR02611 family)
MRILKATLGFSLLALGIVMLVTPGPGWVAIAGGLALLASEYDWARKWLQYIPGRRFKGLRP